MILSTHYAQLYTAALDEQVLRHADRGNIIVEAWNIAKRTGATVVERHMIYEREMARLRREFQRKWGIPA